MAQQDTGERHHHADAWNGDEGDHWVRHRERYDTMLAAHTGRLMRAARIEPDERVLDVGCGCGQTSRLAARAATRGDVLGVDVSGPMLTEARRLAEHEGLRNTRFEHADAQTHRLDRDGLFDVVLSRFGVMFFEDPEAAFANLARAVRPGGRLAFLCWQELIRNDNIIVPFSAIAAFAPPPQMGEPGGPGPFSMADPQAVETLLTGAGFTEVALEPVTEPVSPGSDVEDVVGYLQDHPIGGSMLGRLEGEAKDAALAALKAALEPYETADGLFLGSAAWLVTARRTT